MMVDAGREASGDDLRCPDARLWLKFSLLGGAQNLPWALNL